MASDWTDSVALIVPIEDEERACGEAARLSGNPRDRDGFFSIRLSPTGVEPATHLGAHSRVRSHVVESLPSVKQKFSGADYAITTGDEPPVVFDALAALMGLERIQTIPPEIEEGQ